MGGNAEATAKRSRRNKQARLQRQIEAIERQLRTHPKIGRSRGSLELELEALCAKREALAPLEDERERIRATQLRSRHTQLQKRPTTRPGDHRPVEDLAVGLTCPKRRRPTLTRHYT